MRALLLVILLLSFLLLPVNAAQGNTYPTIEDVVHAIQEAPQPVVSQPVQRPGIFTPQGVIPQPTSLKQSPRQQTIQPVAPQSAQQPVQQATQKTLAKIPEDCATVRHTDADYIKVYGEQPAWSHPGKRFQWALKINTCDKKYYLAHQPRRVYVSGGGYYPTIGYGYAPILPLYSYRSPYASLLPVAPFIPAPIPAPLTLPTYSTGTNYLQDLQLPSPTIYGGHLDPVTKWTLGHENYTQWNQDHAGLIQLSPQYGTYNPWKPFQ